MAQTSNFRDIFTIPSTPFLPSGEIDVEGFKRIVDFCIECGAHGLVVCCIVSMGFFASEVQAKTKLTAMVWGSTERLENNAQAIFNVYPELAEEMELEVVVGGTSDFEVAEKFRLALAAGEEMPDIIQFNWTQIPEFGSAGVLADLTEAVKPYMAQLPSGVQAAMFWDGNVVTYPYEIKTKLFYYREDMFAEAGIDPTQWKTLDDFIAAGKQFHEKFPESYIWNWGKQSLHYDMFMMVQAFGG